MVEFITAHILIIQFVVTMYTIAAVWTRNLLKHLTLGKLNLPKIILVDAEVEHNVYTYSRRSVMTTGKAILLSTYGTI